MHLVNILEMLRLLICAVGFGTGGIFLKRYANSGMVLDLWVSMGAYLTANLLFIDVLRRGLGYGMVTSSMVQLILMTVAGVWLFDEKLSPMQMAGLACALLAIALFSVPSTGGGAGT